MASEKAAQQARKQYSDELFGKGIHGLLVDKVRLNDEETFALVALVPESYRRLLPQSLTVSVGSKEVEVPLVTQKAPRFKPE